MSSIFLYGIVITKKFIKHYLHLLLPLIFASWCFRYNTPAVVSQHIWTPFSTLPLFSLGNIMMELLPCSLETDPLFSGKIIQMGMQKIEVSMTCYITSHRMMKLAPAQCYSNFPLFHCVESFCICFQMLSWFFFL